MYGCGSVSGCVGCGSVSGCVGCGSVSGCVWVWLGEWVGVGVDRWEGNGCVDQ